MIEKIIDRRILKLCEKTGISFLELALQVIGERQHQRMVEPLTEMELFRKVFSKFGVVLEDAGRIWTADDVAEFSGMMLDVLNAKSYPRKPTETWTDDYCRMVGTATGTVRTDDLFGGIYDVVYRYESGRDGWRIAGMSVKHTI